MLDSQGTGDVGHGRTVERVGDQLVVTFGNGRYSLPGSKRAMTNLVGMRVCHFLCIISIIAASCKHLLMARHVLLSGMSKG